MSRLETRVKPILVPLMIGRTAELNKYNQEILATWLTVKLQVCEFSDPENIVTPAIERSLVMGRRRPPDITGVWIGRYTGPARQNGYLRHAATLGWAPVGNVPKAPPAGSFAKNTQAQSFTIGELFVHSTTTTVERVGFDVPPYLAGKMFQIWPFQRAVMWPPPHGLSDAHVYAAITDFERFSKRLPFAPGPAGE